MDVLVRCPAACMVLELKLPEPGNKKKKKNSQRKEKLDSRLAKEILEARKDVV